MAIYCNEGVAKYTKQQLIELKKETDKNIIIAADLNTPLTGMDRSSKQEIKKGTSASNNTIDQINITNITEPFIPEDKIIHIENSQQ